MKCNTNGLHVVTYVFCNSVQVLHVFLTMIFLRKHLAFESGS